MSGAPGSAHRARPHGGLHGAPAAGTLPILPDTDWLGHALHASGPKADVAAFAAAAAGGGGIPWAYPDLDLIEEDQVFSLMHPPDGSAGLSLAAARVLARQLRGAVETHHHRVLGAAEQRRGCPFDLHSLVPIPSAVLRQGPDDPGSRRWLWEHWGTTRALRHVLMAEPDPPDRRARRVAALHFTFWSADWTPWAALIAIRKAWPTLVFDLRPQYDRGLDDHG
jgi:hypothetical protein